MKARRAVTTPEQLNDIIAGQPLPSDVVHYLVRVLRLRAGSSVELADGRGRLVTGRLTGGGHEWSVEDCTVERPGEFRAPLDVLAALIKANRWRYVVEKCVELGVRSLTPVLTTRTVVRPDGERLEQHQQRWTRLAQTAAKQCRRPMATAIRAPVPLVDALERCSADSAGLNRLVADPHGQTEGWSRDLRVEAATVILVGPEGGLTQAELKVARECGFSAVALGAHALRTETAVVALVAMVRDRLGYLAREMGVEESCP